MRRNLISAVLIAMPHAARVRIQLGTLTPAEGDTRLSYGTAATNTTREAINEWIRHQHLSDGFVDFDAAVRSPSDPGQSIPRLTAQTTCASILPAIERWCARSGLRC